MRRGTIPRGRTRPAAGFIVVVALAIALAGCGDGYGGTGPEYDPPGDHTLRRGGALHAPGASDPFANCTECHGADLRGGAAGEPSCHLCHGEVWAARAPGPR